MAVETILKPICHICSQFGPRSATFGSALGFSSYIGERERTERKRREGEGSRLPPALSLSPPSLHAGERERESVSLLLSSSLLFSPAPVRHSPAPDTRVVVCTQPAQPQPSLPNNKSGWARETTVQSRLSQEFRETGEKK